MCGFFQVIQKQRPVDETRFRESLALIKHRGPDFTGVEFSSLRLPGSASLHLGFGHQRLSILDLDPRSAQPFGDGGATLLFNGEIYNFRELRDEFPGHQWQTTGDTEVLFQGLKKEGVGFLPKLNGMFAFTFFNRESGTLIAARDRHGKKPLFFYEEQETLVFSSLMQPISRYLGRPLRLKTDELHTYLQHGKMYPGATSATPYEEIHQVLPGQVLHFDLAKNSRRADFYDPLWPGDLHREAKPELLAETLEDAVRMRLVSDRQVGILLSGGIDSTLVLSILHATGLHEKVKCYIGETGRSEDAAYAKKCVEQLGIQARVIDLSYQEDTLGRYLEMCRHHEKVFPFLGNALGMAEMYARIGEEDVPVVLDGTGGDEQFGGYWDRSFVAATRQAMREGNVKWLAENARANRETAKRLVSEFGRCLTDNSLFQLDLKTRRRRLSKAYRLLGLQRHARPDPDPLHFPCSDFTDAMRLDLEPGGRLGEWIWHNDRNAMMSGIENRSPLLDYRLRRFIGTPYAAKIRAGVMKYELREAFDRFTPLPTQWRKQKQGFRWNGRNFLRENREAILELIAGSKILRENYRLERFLDGVRKSPRLITHALTPRLLCIAGLEEKLGVI